MTSLQMEILNDAANALGLNRGDLPIMGESAEGYVLTEWQGISVVIATKRINPRGGYKLPSVRSYTEKGSPTNLDAVIRIKELFDRQVPDPERKTGHFGPLVNSVWKCNSQDCPCQKETYAQRLYRSTSRR